jgi:hypothetical protein
MNALKKLARLIIVPIVAAIVFYIKKLVAFGAVATILTLLHLTVKDSATSTRPRTAKPQRQVAQGAPAKANPADKLVGPIAPVTSSGPAITPSAPLGAGPIQAARSAAAAQNAQLAKETGQDVPAPKGTTPAAPPAAAPAQASTSPSTQVVQQGMPTPAKTVASKNSVDAPVMRESFDYTRDTRRDPFVSLMTTSDLRPTLTDLRLTGILYDLSGHRPVAILRDIAGGQWRVTTGMTLGRMRVAQIKPKTIIFTIEEFGFNRQDSLILGDTTRVRHR